MKKWWGGMSREIIERMRVYLMGREMASNLRGEIKMEESREWSSPRLTSATNNAHHIYISNMAKGIKNYMSLLQMMQS